MAAWEPRTAALAAALVALLLCSCRGTGIPYDDHPTAHSAVASSIQVSGALTGPVTIVNVVCETTRGGDPINDVEADFITPNGQRYALEVGRSDGPPVEIQHVDNTVDVTQPTWIGAANMAHVTLGSGASVQGDLHADSGSGASGTIRVAAQVTCI